MQIGDLNAKYAACLDSGRLKEWLEFFTEDAWYRVVPRENYERGLPLSTLSLRGVPMMRDRLHGVESTIFHAPYYQRHVIGPSRLVSRDGNSALAETNYLVIRTKRDVPAEIFNVGVYIDEVTTIDGDVKLARRFCVFDNDIIPNSLIYPI
jgi:salicylate 5-hydroxylase small subunit